MANNLDAANEDVTELREAVAKAETCLATFVRASPLESVQRQHASDGELCRLVGDLLAALVQARSLVIEIELILAEERFAEASAASEWHSAWVGKGAETWRQAANICCLAEADRDRKVLEMAEARQELARHISNWHI